MKITEENFIEQMKKGNEKALEYVIGEYGWIIKTVVKKHLYKLDTYQEECTSDILMGIWNNIDKFDTQKSTFKNWVAGVAKYKSLNYARKYLKDLEYENIDELEMSDEDHAHKIVIQETLDDELKNMLSTLKQEDQDLLIRLYIEEQEIDKVSYETGLKKEVIYNRVSRSKKKLRTLFKTRESRG